MVVTADRRRRPSSVSSSTARPRPGSRHSRTRARGAQQTAAAAAYFSAVLARSARGPRSLAGCVVLIGGGAWQGKGKAAATSKAAASKKKKGRADDESDEEEEDDEVEEADMDVSEEDDDERSSSRSKVRADRRGLVDTCRQGADPVLCSWLCWAHRRAARRATRRARRSPASAWMLQDGAWLLPPHVVMITAPCFPLFAGRRQQPPPSPRARGSPCSRTTMWRRTTMMRWWRCAMTTRTRAPSDARPQPLLPRSPPSPSVRPQRE